MIEHPKTLEEIADEQFVAAINSAFRMGARACREMMARFVEQGPPTDPKTLAGSIRANWSPHWGDDAGPPDEYPVELGALEARVDAEKFAASAVAKALTMLDDEPTTIPTPDEICERLREPHWMPDADYMRSPESISGTVKLMREERFEAADLIQQQLAEIERLSAEKAELTEWAFEQSAIHHRLAHESDDDEMRGSHIASSAAYRELALKLDAALGKDAK